MQINYLSYVKWYYSNEIDADEVHVYSTINLNLQSQYVLCMK